ncbi:MAG: penicillin acylase family protein [Ignavibacteriae bacterium]|nr:penicillin acylase family protein [Ignavibacteriota bacterium]
MSSRARILGPLFLAAALLPAGIFAVYHILVRSLPDEDGNAELGGLASQVEVFRDEVGVPHILASSEADMYRAAGYVHAQDRLWQMDLYRRYARGRLAEIFGARAVESDKLMRTVGIGRIADTLARHLAPETRSILAAYCDGVNAAIKARAGRYPVEFDILQYEPEAWSIADCLAVSRLVAWELALSWWTDLTFGDLASRLGEAKAREVLPLDDAFARAILPARTPPPPAGQAFLRGVLDTRSMLGMSGSAIGSNCWAVTGAKSATGLPILANDTHLPHAQPARWYVMHMSCPGINVAGITIAGAPGIVAGHNDHIMWGVTNAMVDDVDFFRERISFADSTYEYRGASRRLRVRIDSILVRDSAAVEHVVYETAHGPVIDGVHPARPGAPTAIGAVPLAMRWAGAERSDEVGAMARVNRARGWAEFVAALRDFGVPGQNFTFADRHGALGYTLAARIPLRPAAGAVLPSDGWDGVGDWRGFVPYEELPRAAMIEGDAFANANNPINPALPYYVTALWESDARAQRITRLLAQRKAYAARDFRLMQMDVGSESAPALRDAFVLALARMPSRPIELTRAMNLLAQWDGRMTETSLGAALLNASFVQLAKATFEDEMGEATYRLYTTVSNVPVRVLPRLLSDTTATWFDDVRTAGIETRDDILRKSVMLALLDLSRRLGPSMDQWSWGALHTVTFRHPLGELRSLGRLLNVGPFPVAGNTSTINNGEFAIARPYDAAVGAAVRLIVDAASIDTCYIVLPTGQSGEPLSPHYADQAILWQNGAYHRLVTNLAAIRVSSWHRLTLSPSR